MDAGNYPTSAVREAAIPQAFTRLAKSIEELDALANLLEKKVQSVSMPPSPKMDKAEACAPQPIKPPMVVQLDGLYERVSMIGQRIRNQVDRLELTP